MNGWIKSYRQSVENPVWRNDPTAWRVFEALMWICDYETGEWQGGRFRLAEICELNANTLKSAVARLVKAEMITTSGTTRFTVYSICKWSQYQSSDTTSDTNETPTKHQRNTTIKRSIRSKEVKEEDINVPKGTLGFGNPGINQAFVDWQEATGIAITSNVKRNRNAASNLLKKHGAETLGKLLKLVAVAQQTEYAPRIADFCQLQSKTNELLVWAKSQGVAAQKHEIVSV